MPKAPQAVQQSYQQMSTRMAPRKPILRNMVAAFVTGGIICSVGQVILNYWIAAGQTTKDAIGLASGTLVVMSALLTGFGVYDLIGRFGGMGSALPITGFANSIVSPAMEYRREGMVLGIGVRMFTVAGPVIVFGLATSFLVVLVQQLLR
ncbi:MAG: stage V sporulation protein AC [Bacillota bacterium]